MMDIDLQFPSLMMKQKNIAAKYYVFNRSLIKSFIIKDQAEKEKI